MGNPVLLVVGLALLSLTFPATWQALRGKHVWVAGCLFFAGVLVVLMWIRTLTTQLLVVNDGQQPLRAYVCPSGSAGGPCEADPDGIAVGVGSAVRVSVPTGTTLTLVLLRGRNGALCLSIGAIPPHLVRRVVASAATQCGTTGVK